MMRSAALAEERAAGGVREVGEPRGLAREATRGGAEAEGRQSLRVHDEEAEDWRGMEGRLQTAKEVRL